MSCQTGGLIFIILIRLNGKQSSLANLLFRSYVRKSKDKIWNNDSNWKSSSLVSLYHIVTLILNLVHCTSFKFLLGYFIQNDVF